MIGYSRCLRYCRVMQPAQMQLARPATYSRRVGIVAGLRLYTLIKAVSIEMLPVRASEPG